MKIDKTGQMADDDYWIAQYRQGNQEGMQVLYQRYYQKVYYKCLALCKDPDQAFDLAQDVLLKTFEHLHAFRGLSSFSTWLYTLTYNHYREFFRKSKRLLFSRLNEHYEGNQDNFAAAFSDGASQQETSEGTMLALLNTIPELDKMMLFLKYKDGQSIGDLQTRFMLSASAVKMRLKRARAKLNVQYAKAIA
jgi:RNA polymerase sigma factor (sigma-70 family)